MRRKNISDKNFVRTVVLKKGEKQIYYNCADIFDGFTVTRNNFYKTINIEAEFLDYDINDHVVNRKIILNKRAAFHLVLDLIKYIFTGRI